MKYGKKIVSSIVTAVACLSLSIVAFAGTSSTPANGYGTLTGKLGNITYDTSVNYNNDNAYLTIKGEIQDYNGKTISIDSIQSTRGKTTYSGNWRTKPSGSYKAYGTHGVQGGSKYGAHAVYTITSL